MLLAMIACTPLAPRASDAMDAIFGSRLHLGSLVHAPHFMPLIALVNFVRPPRYTTSGGDFHNSVPASMILGLHLE